MENRNNGSFSYTYSAKEQEEVRRIREKYTDGEEDKMTRLRRLDAAVSGKAQAVSLALGIIGVLILGLGMSLVMSDFGAILGAHRDLAMPLGILVGTAGGVLASLAYPIHNFILRRERKKIAPEILRLTEELMK